MFDKNLFMSFSTIFSYVILGWYYDILGWKLCKQTSYWSKTVFFSQFASWKRNRNKNTLKKLVNSDFEIGETINCLAMKIPGREKLIPECWKALLMVTRPVKKKSIFTGIKKPFFKLFLYFSKSQSLIPIWTLVGLIN